MARGFGDWLAAGPESLGAVRGAEGSQIGWEGGPAGADRDGDGPWGLAGESLPEAAEAFEEGQEDGGQPLLHEGVFYGDGRAS